MTSLLRTLLGLLLLSAIASAQEASIRGQVLRRGVVPMAGARVRYVADGSGAAFETQADDSGRYELTAIPLSVPRGAPQPVPAAPAFLVAGSGSASASFLLRDHRPQRALRVYDILGRTVAEIPLTAQPAGGVWLSHGHWDGRTNQGLPAADGLYFATAGNLAAKFIHLRAGPALDASGSADLLRRLLPEREAPRPAAPTLDDEPFRVELAPDSLGSRFAARSFTRTLAPGDNGDVLDSVASAPPRSVLCIGNSYTFYNDGVDYHFFGLVHAADSLREFRAARVAEPGFTLENHWSHAPTREALAAADYDLVLLQEQSTRPVTNPALMFQYARLLNGEILRVHRETAFFMTWARENRPGMTDSLADAYGAIGAELGAVVAPAGLAWQRARELEPSLILYDPDGSHPSALGTYLTCYVFFAALMQESPVGVPYPPDGLISPVTRDFLQSVAWETVQQYDPWIE